MIYFTHTDRAIHDFSVLKVGDRWYICSEAVYNWYTKYDSHLYTTSTLKFMISTDIHGYEPYLLDGFRIEIMGYRQSLKLEYI